MDATLALAILSLGVFVGVCISGLVYVAVLRGETALEERLKMGQGGGRPHDLLDAVDLLQRRLETLEQHVMRLSRLEDER